MLGRRTTILAFVLTAALVLGVTSAQAAGNIVLNPGFETTGGGCGTLPCNWAAEQGAGSISRDTNNPHTGAASLALVSDGSAGFAQASSDCFAVSPSTLYNVAMWYRTTASILSAEILVRVFDGAGCTGNLSNFVAEFPAVTTGVWTQVTAQIQPDASIQSGRFLPRFNCPGGGGACAADVQVNFDDVVMQTDPLAVTVASFAAARRTSQGVLLRWRTGTEADLLGFEVYRLHGRSSHVLTRSLIVAKGSVSGAAYRFLDRTAKRGAAYRYRIKAVKRDGTTSWFGPVLVT